jgi:hypothetical protein
MPFRAPCAEPVIGNSRLAEDEYISMAADSDDVIAAFGAAKLGGLVINFFRDFVKPAKQAQPPSPVNTNIRVEGSGTA